MTIDAPKPFHVPSLRALWQEAFGDGDEFLDMFFRTAFSPERSRCVTVGDTAVAALYWFDCSYREERIAYLYAVATAKAYREQGLATLLMEDTHRHLKEMGYVGAVLVPGTRELFAFYQKKGYRICSRIGEFRSSASTRGVQLQRIGTSEYAALRRKFLPRGAILQENENLKFLEAQAEFYKGDGFLLAAMRKRDILYGVELLGNTAIAPDIVRSLGCTEGHFRTPDGDTPFAMYRTLGDPRLSRPLYFGLAFD